ncbi:hypothetical protein NHF46_03420 [Arthrobacter alpinus]|nr:hypothetical protein [Arthrobacter alpinus]
MYLLWLSVVLSIIDIRTHTLPNRYVLPAYPISGALLLAAALGSAMPGHALRAGVAHSPWVLCIGCSGRCIRPEWGSAT